jgi:hypothetical protein
MKKYIVTFGIFLMLGWIGLTFRAGFASGLNAIGDVVRPSAKKRNSGMMPTVWRPNEQKAGNCDKPRFVDVNIYGAKDFRNFRGIEREFRNSFGLIGNGKNHFTGTAVIIKTDHPKYEFMVTVAHNFYDNNGEEIYDEFYYHVGGMNGKKIKIKELIDGTRGNPKRRGTQDDWAIALIEKSDIDESGIGYIRGLGYPAKKMTSEDYVMMARDYPGQLQLAAFHSQKGDRRLKQPTMSDDVEILLGGRDMGKDLIKHTADNRTRASGGGLVFVNEGEMYLLGVHVGDYEDMEDGVTANNQSAFGAAVNFSRILNDFKLHSNPNIK